MTDDTPTLRLKKNEERRLKAGHEWIYANEVDTAHSPVSYTHLTLPTILLV